MTRYEIVAMTTAGSARLAANFLESTRRSGVDDRVRMYCLDERSRVALEKLLPLTDSAAQIIEYRPVVAAQFKLRDDLVEWGTPDYLAVGLAKLSLMMDRCPKLPPPDFRPFLYSDVDIVLLANPFIGLDCPAPISFQSDRQDHEAPTAADWQLCAGLFVCNEPVNSLWVNAFEFLLSKAPEIHAGNFVCDQGAVNECLKRTGAPYGYLDPYEWPNGARDWGEDNSLGWRYARRPTRSGGSEAVRVKAIHANWCKGAEKEARLRAAGLWYLSPDHFREVGL